jgi:hypothetical protein
MAAEAHRLANFSAADMELVDSGEVGCGQLLEILARAPQVLRDHTG